MWKLENFPPEIIFPQIGTPLYCLWSMYNKSLLNQRLRAFQSFLTSWQTFPAPSNQVAPEEKTEEIHVTIFVDFSEHPMRDPLLVFWLCLNEWPLLKGFVVIITTINSCIWSLRTIWADNMIPPFLESVSLFLINTNDKHLDKLFLTLSGDVNASNCMPDVFLVYL